MGAVLQPLPPARRPAEVPVPAQPGDDPIIRVYVWEVPVRLVHWTIFFALIVLSVTGYYLYNPFFVVRGQTAYTLATMRFIHEVTAFVFTAAFLVRIYWFFVGNDYARWKAFIPITRQQRRGVGEMLKYYLFLRWMAPDEVGHNPLAASVYLLIYVLFLVQILTGFALYQWLLGSGPLTAMFGWLPRLINIQYLRETHFLLMFIFFAFTIHHVYSALLVSLEAANGLMGSIMSGHKFVRRSILRKEQRGE
ncbi:MAG TPA: Ni/Fe-hydrogenase, b-type cytochrome subunit [Chloroflexota bacterium]|nr:Ni/Fe-hydrogenase, b-type cytochrome subunit [Chloroflexota bacterium]